MRLVVSALHLSTTYIAHFLQDVWQELHIATQPDMKTGRRGSVLSVCGRPVMQSHFNTEPVMQHL